MPNHIKNRIIFTGDQEVINSGIKATSTIIPAHQNLAHDGSKIYHNGRFNPGWLMPNGKFMDVEKNIYDRIPEGYEPDIEPERLHFPDFEKIIPPPDCDEYHDKPNQAQCRTSPNWWYNWNVKNWGTKWNSYSNEKVSDTIYEFETAWSGVPDLIIKMSEYFPGVLVEYMWADEDTGSNVGKLWVKNRRILQQLWIESGTKFAYELAFELRPEAREGYTLVNGEYIYNEE